MLQYLWFVNPKSRGNNTIMVSESLEHLQRINMNEGRKD